MSRGGGQVNLTGLLGHGAAGRKVSRGYAKASVTGVTFRAATTRAAKTGEPGQRDSATGPAAWLRRSGARKNRPPARRQLRTEARLTPGRCGITRRWCYGGEGVHRLPIAARRWQLADLRRPERPRPRLPAQRHFVPRHGYRRPRRASAHGGPHGTAPAASGDASTRPRQDRSNYG